MFFAQMPANVFAANQKNNIPLDIVLVLDVSGSMEDPITSTDTTKRIKILKDSINQFIEEFAKNNSKQSDEKYQSRISIIKFAGDKSDKVGNDTYTENRYRYNYTQIMNDFFTATNDNKAKLEDVVNSISPAGATRSDFAMELALKQINQSKNDEKWRKAHILNDLYVEGKYKPKISVMSEKYHISERQIRRDANSAIEEIAVLMFGIDGIRKM